MAAVAAVFSCAPGDALMGRDKTLDPNNELVEVNWDDPRVQQLLKKSEGLRLDGRGSYRQRPVRLWCSWQSAGTARRALLAGESGAGVFTVLTDFPLERGQPVALELQPGNAQVTGRQLCKVINCRAGNRAEDGGRQVYVVRLQSSVVR